MDHFQRRDGRLFAEDVDVSDIASACGTPCYIYSRATLERHWRAFDSAFNNPAGSNTHPHLVLYAVKANSNLAVLNVMAKLGSGFDIVSGGELARVLAAGGDAKKTVFSGVGKSVAEIDYALQSDIACFNVESAEELALLNDRARALDKRAPIALRVNPDVDANTHPYISTGLRENKFGIDHHQVLDVYRHAADMDNIDIAGIACHIGSQLTDTAPYVDALHRLLDINEQLHDAGIELRHLDIGGGLGIRYQDETPPPPAQWAAVVKRVLKQRGVELPLHMEPGRAIAGNAGILLTRVQFIKSNSLKKFAIVDAAMNDLIRPALYSAWHEIVEAEDTDGVTADSYDVVGPVCETGDFLARQRRLKVAPGALLAIRSAGAYAFVMSSNYNSRPRAAEIMVDGDAFVVVRERESQSDLYAGERLLPG